MESPSKSKNIMEAPPSDDPFAALDIIPTKELPLPMEFGSGAAIPSTSAKKEEPNSSGSSSGGNQQ
jgi:hypothetical protein